MDASRSSRAAGALAVSGLFLLMGGVGLLLSRTTLDSYDASIMGQVATGLVNHASIKVTHDPYQMNIPYSFYGLGMSLLMIPGILVAKITGSTSASGIMLTNAWLIAVLSVGAYQFARLRRLSRRWSLTVGTLMGLGGGLLPYTSTGMAEVSLAVAVGYGLVGLEATRQGLRWGPYVLGAAAGTSVLVRDDSIALVFPWLLIGALLLRRADPRFWLRFCLGGAPFAALWAWYNVARYGAPWRTGYSGVFKLDHPFFAGLYGLTISPGRGLLFYAPLVVVAGSAAHRAWRSDPVLTATAGALLLSRIVFYAPYWGWYGGGNFGPRYVLPGTAALVVGLVELPEMLKKMHRPARSAVAAFCLAAIAVGFVGGLVRYGDSSLDVTVSSQPNLQLPPSSAQVFLDHIEAVSAQNTIDHLMFDWRLFPLTNEVTMVANRTQLASAALTRPADRARLLASMLLMLMGSAVLVTLRLKLAREHQPSMA
jgi:hypothetical protein